MQRLNLFLKGNLDLKDSLHSLRLNGKLQWNGVNETARLRFPGLTVRTHHETWTRSDALLQSKGCVPDDLIHRHLPLHAYSAMSQFSLAVYNAKVDAILFSIQPDVMTNLFRHREQGYLFYPELFNNWPKADIDWLKTNFEPVDRLDVSASMENFSKIITNCRTHSNVPILVYNLSSIILEDCVHCYEGLEETLSTRIKRFNLGLIELSQKFGISIVDVDAIVGRYGAGHLKIDSLHLNAEACRLVAEEVVRILEDWGCLDEA